MLMFHTCCTVCVNTCRCVNVSVCVFPYLWALAETICMHAFFHVYVRGMYALVTLTHTLLQTVEDVMASANISIFFETV